MLNLNLLVFSSTTLPCNNGACANPVISANASFAAASPALITRTRRPSPPNAVGSASIAQALVLPDCRLTCASTLLSGGVSVAAAADYLMATPPVVLKTYAHLMPADHDRARAVVQAAFARPTEAKLRPSGTV